MSTSINRLNFEKDYKKNKNLPVYENLDIQLDFEKKNKQNL
jgi:hypothetical protein